MAKCEYCNAIESPKTKLVYEDDKVIAFLHPEPACEGHLVIMPKEHFVIIEQVPDYIVAHMFHVANKLSVAAFDALNALGTNILIQNGTAAGQKTNHVSINVLPRTEGDALDFTWNPKQLSQEEMSTIELQMKELCSNIGDFTEEGASPIVMNSLEPITDSDDDTEDYREKIFFGRQP